MLSYNIHFILRYPLFMSTELKYSTLHNVIDLVNVV